MKIITAENINTGVKTEWLIPSVDEAIAHSKKTDGVQFDKIERKNVSGGLPMVWERVK